MDMNNVDDDISLRDNQKIMPFIFIEFFSVLP